MLKRRVQSEILNELESSDDEFYMDSYENDDLENSDGGNSDEDNSDKENVSSGSDIVINKKRKTVPLPESSSSSEDSDSDNYGPWQDVTIDDNIPKRFDFTSGTKTEGPQIPGNCTKPVDFFKLFFTAELVEKIVEETNR